MSKETEAGTDNQFIDTMLSLSKIFAVTFVVSGIGEVIGTAVLSELFTNINFSDMPVHGSLRFIAGTAILSAVCLQEKNQES